MKKPNEESTTQQIAQRVKQVQRNWDADEVVLRQEIGQQRRQQLLALIELGNANENREMVAA